MKDASDDEGESNNANDGDDDDDGDEGSKHDTEDDDYEKVVICFSKKMNYSKYFLTLSRYLRMARAPFLLQQVQTPLLVSKHQNQRSKQL